MLSQFNPQSNPQGLKHDATLITTGGLVTSGLSKADLGLNLSGDILPGRPMQCSASSKSLIIINWWGCFLGRNA